MSDINDILNQSDLDINFANNTTNDITPTDLRQFVASVAPYGGVMRLTAQAAYAVTLTPTNLDFDSFNIPGNDLMTFDIANNKCTILAGGIYYVTWRLQGDWVVTDDIELRVFIDEVPDDFAYSLTKGLGTSNPLSISVSNYPIPISSAEVLAGGGSVDLSLRISTNIAGNIEIYNAQMEVNYASLTKDLF